MQRVTGVQLHSIAHACHIKEGDALLSINGQPVIDSIDYAYLTADEHLLLRFLQEDGTEYTAEVEKEAFEPLGLDFASGLMSEVRSCRNKCIFCFIDQMPKGGRKSLHFKDDDWRMSFIMGNYVSLTNVDDAEFARIIQRRVSPLFVSVHATNADVRCAMMRNPTAGRLMERLSALKEAQLQFHCQIVCCPDVNDKDVLRQTLEDLASLRPAAQSVAIVPVGLTKFRSGLSPLRIFTRQEAHMTLRQIQTFAAACMKDGGSRFAFASDELYLLAGERLPEYEEYEGFPQIENGVGLLRSFEAEFLAAIKEQEPLPAPYRFDAAGGMVAHAFFKELYQRLEDYNILGNLHAIRNDFFGDTITVGGLLTGRDLVEQLRGKLASEVLLIPHNMLRETEDIFLDNMTLEELSAALQVVVIPVRGEGEEWIRTLFALALQPAPARI